MWQEIENTDGAICYEQKGKDLSVRIEAREDDGEWVIYRGFYTPGNMNYTERFSAETREDAEGIVSRLRKERLPSMSEITELVKTKSKKMHLSMKRAYKDDMVEKWFFNVNEDTITNFFIVREFEKVEMDIVLHQNYKDRASEVVRQISKFLSYESVFVDIEHNVYFFSSSEKHAPVGKKLLDRYELEFEFKNR
jgi:hypothetical protein